MTMAKTKGAKRQKDKQLSTKHYMENKKLCNTLRKSKQFVLH